MHATEALFDIIGGGLAIFGLGLAVLMIASAWKVFVKAGQPGWFCLIPILNLIVLVQIANKPMWWVLLLFIPIVGFIIGIIVHISVAERFGRGAGFGVGLSLLPMIFWPILAFSDAQLTR